MIPRPERGFRLPRKLVPVFAVSHRFRVPIDETKIAAPVMPGQGAGISGCVAARVARHAEIADSAARPLSRVLLVVAEPPPALLARNIIEGQSKILEFRE